MLKKEKDSKTQGVKREENTKHMVQEETVRDAWGRPQRYNKNKQKERKKEKKKERGGRKTKGGES